MSLIESFLIIIFFVVSYHPCSYSLCRPLWGWHCCTVCRTTAGKGSRPGCTAWACVPSSWSPLCFISSPGRRVTWGEDWSANKHPGRRPIPGIPLRVCRWHIFVFYFCSSLLFWNLTGFSVPFLWLPALIICSDHLGTAYVTRHYFKRRIGTLMGHFWNVEWQIVSWVSVLVKAFMNALIHIFLPM